MVVHIEANIIVRGACGLRRTGIGRQPLRRAEGAQSGDELSSCRCVSHGLLLAQSFCAGVDATIEKRRARSAASACGGKMSTTRFVINGSDDAFARLTGKRLRSLPMSAEQVLQALRA
jgi:hypothetical protein